MARLWIVDRSRQRRAALARLAAATEDAVLGAPGELRFESEPAPDVVVMTLSGNWERELQFAYTVGRDAPNARWILVGQPGDAASARERFDTREVAFFTYPPDANDLRQHIASDRESDRAPSLSERARREAVANRFGRWFGDLDLPDALRALDPRLSDVPVWIRGERGTGRSVVARYIHFFGGNSNGTLAHVPCNESMRPEELIAAIDTSIRVRPTPTLTIWLENLDLLPLSTQRVLLAWLESGPPGLAARAHRRRWMASVTEPAHESVPDPSLRLALSGVVIALPTLRSRPRAIRTLASDTARVWCAARREVSRRFGEDALSVMEEYPWPGNLRELEALVTQSLAATTSDPVLADDLRLEGVPFAPLNASEIGSLIEDGDVRRDEAVAAELDAFLEHEAPEPKRQLPTPHATSPVTGQSPSAERLAEAEPETLQPPAALSSSPVKPPDMPTPAERLALHGVDPEWPERFDPLDPVGPFGDGSSALERDADFETFDDLGFDDDDAEQDDDELDFADDASAEDETALPFIEAERLPDENVEDLAGLARALAPANRDPGEVARVLSRLVPDRFDDASERDQLARAIRESGSRLDPLAERLAAVRSLGNPIREKVNIAQLLEDLLEQRRDRIRQRRLLVLKELDTAEPHALGDTALLGLTLESLLGTALDWVPPHGDVYLASRHHPAGPTTGATVRVLIRFHNPGPGAGDPPALAIAEALVRAQGGTVGVASNDGDETVVLIDLPAP